MTAPVNCSTATAATSMQASCRQSLSLPNCWQLGCWYIEPSCNRISNGENTLQLEPRLMTALVTLLSAEGQTVSDQQLLCQVWPNVVVSDASLYQVIAQLRKTLGDQQKPYQFIERVQKKGYRLLPHAKMLQQLPQDKIPGAAIQIENLLQSDAAPTPASKGKQLNIKPNHYLTLMAVAFFIVLYTVTKAIWPQILNLSERSGTDLSETSATIKSEQQLLPEAGIAQQDWIKLQQATYLINKPNADAVQAGITLLQQLLAQQQHSSELLVKLCNGYHAMHIYSDWPLERTLALCEPLLERALKQQADFAPALGSFGALQLSRHNSEGARFYLDQALQLSPEDPIIMLWRASLYRAQGQYNAAIALLEKAIKLAPLSGQLKRHYAYSLLGDGQLSRARAEFKHALLLEDNYSDRALDELELLPLTQERALAFLLWAERFPDRLSNAERWVQLGLVHLSLNQIQQAEASLQQASSLSANNSFVLLGKAMLAQAQGKTTEANNYLQQRARLKPQHKIFQLQAQFLSITTETDISPDILQELLPAYYQNAEQAMAQDLSNNDLLNVLYFLLSQSQEKRLAYQSRIRAFVEKQHVSDSFSLQLLSAVGLTQQAELLALQMLQDGWLPSPHDDYYLAEQHPLWQHLSATFFKKLDQQRQQVITTFAAQPKTVLTPQNTF